MRVLITGAATAFGQALATALSEEHQLRLNDHESISTDCEFIQSELNHDETTDALVADIDIIVHQAYTPRPSDGETAWLDHNSRRTYNLLLAASEAAVKHVILISTLDLFTPYDDHLTVSEHWQPLPSCEPAILGAHLAEFTTREFAHSHALQVTVARLGHLVRSEEVEDQPYDPMWLDERDATHAINRILAKVAKGRHRQYGVVHFQSDAQRARFSVKLAKDHLEFAPQHNFEANP